MTGVESRILKSDELNALAMECKEHFTDERKTRLLQAVYPFCMATASRYSRMFHISKEHFIGSIWFAIDSAIKKYDIGEGSFFTFLSYWLKYYYMDVIGTEIFKERYHNDRYLIQFVSIDAASENIDGRPRSIIETIADHSTDEDQEKRERSSDLKKILGYTFLNDQESNVLKMLFGLDNGVTRTLKDTSDFLNTSKDHIRQVKRRALKKLKHTVDLIGEIANGNAGTNK